MTNSLNKRNAFDHLLTAGLLTISFAAPAALAQKTPSTPVPPPPVSAPKPTPETPSGTPADSALNQAPKTPSTPTAAPSAAPATSAPVPIAVPAPPATPAADTKADPAGSDTETAPAAAPAGTEAKPVDPNSTEVPQGPPGTPLRTKADMPIEPNPMVDGLFNIFNYVSIAALGGAAIFGTLWYFKHKKRVELGLDDDDEDDEEDDDDIVTAKVVVNDPKMIESKNELPDKETEIVEVVDTTVSTDGTMEKATVPSDPLAIIDTTGDALAESIEAKRLAATGGAQVAPLDPATVLSGNFNSINSSTLEKESTDKGSISGGDQTSGGNKGGVGTSGGKKKSRKKN
ncbi:MAG: hypothetical protein SGJ27_15570 [Candidatus Melainabacteria bacterium]|nr:hypothetical protein [Candidatus Melainabacteria bacterium]